MTEIFWKYENITAVSQPSRVADELLKEPGLYHIELVGYGTGLDHQELPCGIEVRDPGEGDVEAVLFIGKNDSLVGDDKASAMLF